MTSKRLVAIASIITLLWAPTALAHEGHGDPAWYGSILHYMSEPVHLLTTLALLGTTVFVSRWAMGAFRKSL